MVSVILSILFLGQMQAPADSLTLEYCYSRIEEQHPTAQKMKVQRNITKLNKNIANRAFYPQFDFGATATYQSEVTELQSPTGGQSFGPELSKDQYRITMDVSQSVYRGGAISIQKKLEAARGDREQQSIKVELHQLKQQVNKVFFGILLARQQKKIIQLMSEDLRARIKNVKAKVSQGVLVPSQNYILQAELKKIEQDLADVQANIKSGYELIGQLIDEDVSINTPLGKPETDYRPIENDMLPKLRPEYELFESSRNLLDIQSDLAETNKMPSVSLFGTAAYGRPGFNVFENQLHPYYIAGLRIKWNFWDAINADSRSQILNLQKKNITQDERAFGRQLKGQLAEARENIRVLEEQIRRDNEIIELRNKVVETVSSQLENGTATATEYITELNKFTQAQLSMRLHKLRFEQAKIEYQTLAGS